MNNFKGVFATVMLVAIPALAGAQDVGFSIETSFNSDTIFAGSPVYMGFNFDARGHTVANIVIPLVFTYTTDSPIDSVDPESSIVWATASQVFESRHASFAEANGVSPDTVVMGLISFGSPWWTDSGEIARLNFVCDSPGTIICGEPSAPPVADEVHAHDLDGAILSCDWDSTRITVLPCPGLMGDLDTSGHVVASDVIYLINYFFKSGPEPVPELALADVNCSGGLSGGDIFYLINYVFKSGPSPCGCFPEVL